MIADIVAGLFKPAAQLIDDLHTSDEERLALRQQMQVTQNELLGKVLVLESEVLKHRAGIITAEAQGQSWLQRSWRPITMLTFLGLVVCDSFGLLVPLR